MGKLEKVPCRFPTENIQIELLPPSGGNNFDYLHQKPFNTLHNKFSNYEIANQSIIHIVNDLFV